MVFQRDEVLQDAYMAAKHVAVDTAGKCSYKYGVFDR